MIVHVKEGTSSLVEMLCRPKVSDESVSKQSRPLGALWLFFQL